MDKPSVKLEAGYKEMDYTVDPSYQYRASLGYSESCFIYSNEGLATVKPKQEIRENGNGNEDIAENGDANQDISENGDGDDRVKDSNRLALERARSLSFGSIVYQGKKEQGKESGTDLLIPYYNFRLRGILEEFISEHRWREAAGVLSALLKGSVRDIYYFRQQSKYWAAMETLRKVEGVQGNELIYKRIFGLLKSKQPAPKLALNKKLRPAVQLQIAMYNISQGDLDGALDASKALVQEQQFRYDPVANLVRGLILYENWYDGVCKELHLEEQGMDVLLEDMEINSLEIRSKSYDLFQKSHPNISGENINEKNVLMLDSDSSIGNEKENPRESRYHSLRKHSNRGPTDGMIENCVDWLKRDTDDEVSSYECGGVVSETTRVLCSPDLDRILFPIRLPRTQEPTKYMIPTERSNLRTFRLDALKHLQVALSSSPPVLGALIPYLQLLLSNGQVKEAWKEIETLCRDSNHILPFSLKARLAESLTPKQPELLSRCYEEILCKNPASSHSAMRLIKLRKKGYYQTESLMEYLALHLEADNGCTEIWRELASCFLEMQAKGQAERESDRLSTEQHGTCPDTIHKCFSSSKELPTVFLKTEVRDNWKLRCRWWAGRHFNRERIYSEQQEVGNWEHMTLKAACASHMLGPTFAYVTDIYAALERMEEKGILSLLKSHIHCSLKLQEYLFKA